MPFAGFAADQLVFHNRGFTVCGNGNGFTFSGRHRELYYFVHIVGHSIIYTTKIIFFDKLINDVLYERPTLRDVISAKVRHMPIKQKILKPTISRDFKSYARPQNA